MTKTYIFCQIKEKRDNTDGVEQLRHSTYDLTEIQIHEYLADISQKN